MTRLPHQLPVSTLKAEWIEMRDWSSKWVPTIMAEAWRVQLKPGWNVKVLHLEGNLYMADMHMFSDDVKGKTPPNTLGITWREYPSVRFSLPAAVLVAELVDHPFLSRLPKHAPRAVKSIYKKEVMLKHLRSRDFLNTHRDIEAANKAWGKFLNGTGPAQMEQQT